MSTIELESYGNIKRSDSTITEDDNLLASKQDIETEKIVEQNETKWYSCITKITNHPRTIAYGKIFLDFSVNFIFPAVDEITDIVSGVKYYQ